MSKKKKPTTKSKTSKATTAKKTTAKKSTKATTKKSTTKPKPAKPKKPKKEDVAEVVDDGLLIEGISYIQDNKLEAALETFEVFAEKYPKSHFGWYYIGYTQLLQQKKKPAKKNFIKAGKLNKKSIPAIYYQGFIEFEENNFENALQIFDGIMEKFNSDEIKQSDFNIPYFIAICHHYLGNLQRAEEYFLFAFNISPTDPVLLYYKGINELAMRNYDFAMDTFKNLLSVDLNNQTFWDLVKGYSYYYHQHEDSKQSDD
ncbi:MAG: tetratricopeptide repeat protein [Candidatus Heimdallarchaeota archaeon]